MASLVERDALIRDIAAAINRHSAETDSNTPDFILAEVAVRALENFALATRSRDAWYSRDTPRIEPVAPPAEPIASKDGA